MNQSADGHASYASAKLSHRQLECLEMAARGYTSKEIGRLIGLSPSTVDNHIRAAVDRLGAKNRTDAVRFLPSLRADSSNDGLIAERPSQHSDYHDKFDWRRLPPLGGKPNELSTRDRLLGMLQIAAVGLAVSAAIILTIAGVVHVLG